MSSSNENSKNNNYSRLSVAGGQCISNRDGHIEIPSKTAKYGPSHIEVKQGEGLILSVGSNHIENGKRIDDNTKTVLQNLKENDENRIMNELAERAKITRNEKLANKLIEIKDEKEGITK